MYKAILYKKFRHEVRMYKMCGIDIHFIINSFNFNNYNIYKLLYIIVTHYQNKTLYKSRFFVHILRICLCLYAYT